MIVNKWLENQFWKQFNEWCTLMQLSENATWNINGGKVIQRVKDCGCQPAKVVSKKNYEISLRVHRHEIHDIL